MAIDRLTLCVAISSIISTISLIEKSGMEIGVIEWMSSPFQRYVKYPALMACAIIFISPRWGKHAEATAKATDGGGRDESRLLVGDANATRASSRGTTSNSVVGGGGSKKKRAKAMRSRQGAATAVAAAGGGGAAAAGGGASSSDHQ